MPDAIACPACGRDATALGNEQIRLKEGKAATPVAARRNKNHLFLISLIFAAILGILGVTVAVFFVYRIRSAVPQERVLASRPASSKTDNKTPLSSDAPASPKPQRDPTWVAVGAMFDRDLKTRHVEITRVLANSPAEEAGIESGDILLSINDEPIQDLRLKEIVELVYGPVGSKISMDLINPDTGKTNRVEMIRRKFSTRQNATPSQKVEGTP